MKNDDKEYLNNSINNRGYLAGVLVILIVLYAMIKWSEYENRTPIENPSTPTNNRR